MDELLAEDSYMEHEEFVPREVRLRAAPRASTPVRGPGPAPTRASPPPHSGPLFGKPPQAAFVPLLPPIREEEAFPRRPTPNPPSRRDLHARCAPLVLPIEYHGDSK